MGSQNLVLDRPSDLTPECRDQMIFHAHEILLEASRIAPKVKTHMHLLQYRQLLTTGIASLEAVIHDANCPEHTKAYTSYILAQVLFAETESLGRVLSALGQGMILAERNGLSDLQLQMECLNVRALCRTNRNAAMLYCNKCLDKYPEMHGNYAFHTLQLLHFDLTLDNSLPQAFAISKSWEELPDSIPKSFLLLYSISKSLDYNVGNYEESQDTLEKMRMFEESSAMLETVPQVVMLRHMVTLLVTLRRDDDTPVKKASEALETVLRTLDRTAKTNGNVWENWNRDGTIKLLGEQGSTFSIQWLSQNQCESFCHYLLGLAGLRHHASLEYGRGLLQDCLELINLNEEDAPGGVLERASFSTISAGATQMLKLECSVQLYTALVNFSGLSYKKGNRAFQKFRSLSKALSDEASDELYSLTCLVAALAAHTAGKLKKAVKYYRRIDSHDSLYPLALANVCCINPSDENLDSLKQTMAQISPEHHIVKHAMFELVRIVQESANMSSLDRNASLETIMRSLHLGMTQQLSYVSRVVSIDMFGSTADQNLQLEDAFRTAVAESDCVWAYIIGEKRKGYLHQLGEEEQLQELNISVAGIREHAQNVLDGCS